MNKSKILETSLVLTTAFIVVYILKPNPVFLYIACGLGVTGILIKPLAKYIAIAWFKLADLLNFFVSKIVLGFIFYVILFPISLLYRLSGKDKMLLKDKQASTWIERDYKYTGKDLENIW